MPAIAQTLWNLAASIAAFVADGCQTVNDAEYAERLAICDGCEHRQEAICQLCGCYIPINAQGRVMQCPVGKWKCNELP